VFVPNCLPHVRFEIPMKVSIILADVHVSVTKHFVSIPVIEAIVGNVCLMYAGDQIFEKVIYISHVLPLIRGLG
jgi:hypothetical protein